MTEYKKYYAGENHYRWEVKLAIYQKGTLYKFVLTDNEDKDSIYITSNYVTSTIAAALERTIDEVMQESAQYESLTDIYNGLKDTFYGRIFLFSIGKKSHRR